MAVNDNADAEGMLGGEEVTSITEPNDEEVNWNDNDDEDNSELDDNKGEEEYDNEDSLEGQDNENKQDLRKDSTKSNQDQSGERNDELKAQDEEQEKEGEIPTQHNEEDDIDNKEEDSETSGEEDEEEVDYDEHLKAFMKLRKLFKTPRNDSNLKGLIAAPIQDYLCPKLGMKDAFDTWIANAARIDVKLLTAVALQHVGDIRLVRAILSRNGLGTNGYECRVYVKRECQQKVNMLTGVTIPDEIQQFIDCADVHQSDEDYDKQVLAYNTTIMAIEMKLTADNGSSNTNSLLVCLHLRNRNNNCIIALISCIQ